MSTSARQWTIVFAASLALVLASPAFAGSLADAKQAGHVGEKLDGTLGLVDSASPEIEALVGEVNAKRRTRFAEIVKESGLDLAAVGKGFGEKAIAKTAPGNYVESPTGGWVKK